MATDSPLPQRCDVAIVGGGHNALVAATYLARAGWSVVVLERSDHVGGAAVSERPFPGVDARLSRYSYLVSVMPDALIADLDLGLELRSRPTASFTPTLEGTHAGGLYVEHVEGAATAESFRALTGSDREYDAWRSFYADVADFARAISPSFLEPLPSASDVRGKVSARMWTELVEAPLGTVVESRFADDLVRGVVATDALIGTFASLGDPSLAQNRCFLYHLVGNGTGEWRVPVGGMGAVTAELARVARQAGAQLATGREVTAIELSDTGAAVTVAGDQTVECDWVLGGAAPAVLSRLRGHEPENDPRGAQLKLNLLVERLPRLRSGVDPAAAFAGTFHVNESYSELQSAYGQAASGRMPDQPPGELYCHTLTDDSILSPELAKAGAHTLTYFGIHMPPEVFEPDVPSARQRATHAALAAIDTHLEEPIESLLVRDSDGNPCLEAKAPQDVEEALAMPGGHIFHGDLGWPWRDEPADRPAERWGVATDHPRLLLCGSGAQRGGAVSGIGGHNAAMALLEGTA